MRIGLITIIDYQNYGNRLQNYATQEVLKSLNIDVLTILNRPNPNPDKKNGIANLRSGVGGFTIKNLLRLTSILPNRVKKHYYSKKVAKFRAFSKEFIVESSFSIDSSTTTFDFEKGFDFFIAGSDQIWNPNFRFCSPIDFLDFTNKKKRVSYASSFGIESIPDNCIQDYKTWLSGFKSLSVREDSGQKIIHNLTGKEAKVLIDPTLMLNEDAWLKISKKHWLKPKGMYLVTYFLGVYSSEIKNFVERVAHEKKLKIVNLGSYTDLLRYDASPGEFIDYIYSSSLVITDSYHGAIFSIIFKKPFWVFERVSQNVSMNTRLNTLLSTLQFNSRRWESSSSSSDCMRCDFSHVDNILRKKRKEAIQYLIESLCIEDSVQQKN